MTQGCYLRGILKNKDKDGIMKFHKYTSWCPRCHTKALSVQEPNDPYNEEYLKCSECGSMFPINPIIVHKGKIIREIDETPPTGLVLKLIKLRK